MSLADFYFGHDEMFIVPIEELTSTGMSASYASMLGERVEGLSADWIPTFNEAYRRYWQRCDELHRLAPKHYRPPRRQNICVVRDPERTRPYYQPFEGSSWFVYASDFDLATSSCELATYVFFQAERLGLVRDVRIAVVHNLSYWLARADNERADFAAGAARATRPDAEAMRALAEAFSWIRRLYHDTISAPSLVLPEPLARIDAAGLQVPRSLQSEVQALAKRFREVGVEIVSQYLERQSKTAAKQSSPASSGAERLITYLREQRPHVLLTAPGGQVLWDPDAPTDVDALSALCEGVSPAPAEGLVADLQVVHARTQRFLEWLGDPSILPPPHELDEAGGTYIHPERKIIVYCLEQPGLRPLAEIAPPFHRWLLGARVMHEWGHLAVDAGCVPIAEGKEDEHRRLHTELKAFFDDLTSNAPPALRDMARFEVEQLRNEGFHLGDMPLKRVDDYRTNLLAKELLPAEELESYVRTNIRSHLDEQKIGPYLKLARYAYEYQYLDLSQVEDPVAYFCSSTWVEWELVRVGVLTQAKLEDLVLLVGELFATYTIRAQPRAQ